MRLLWQDTFAGSPGQAPDASSWTVRTGNWKPGVQEYVAGAAQIVGGIPGSDSTYLALSTKRNKAGFTSARIDTLGKREFRPPVLVTASMSMPAGAQGVVPAFWTLGADPADPGNWPEQGEIDILEWQSNHPVNVGKQSGRACAQTIHGPTRGAEHVPTALGRSSVLAVDQSIGFHTYSMIWLPDRITITVNGASTLDVSAEDFAEAGGDWTPFSGAWPHYLLLNVAVNNGMTPKATAASPFPVSMLVDWVRVYAL